MKLSKIAFAISLFFLPSLGGCGFYSFSGTSISPEVKTFSVSFFENRASIVSPLLSQTVTEGLKQKFISETNLSIVNDDGDFSFSGAITSFVIAPVSAQNSDNAQLNRLSITLQVKLVSAKDPKSEFEQSFTNFQDFDANTNFSAVETALVQEISDMLVQQVFNKAAINW
ncbi:MAG: hypothetical protein RLZZ337_1029 [Bacteroidota bacterium]|jgi:hypothetical protein